MAYRMQPVTQAAFAWLVNGPATQGARALLIEGAPGTGKTAFAEHVAESAGMALVFYQCHSWSGDQELLQGINVSEVVRGNADEAVSDGALLKAAKFSLEGPVMLVLDELDKAQDRVDTLLLDFLQSGRLPGATADLRNLRVVITSNGVRELHPALKRRVRRMVMPELPKDVIDELLMDSHHVSQAVARQCRRVCSICAQQDGEQSSLQEMNNLLAELLANPGAAEFAVQGWAARGPKGLAWLSGKGAKLVRELSALLARG